MRKLTAASIFLILAVILVPAPGYADSISANLVMTYNVFNHQNYYYWQVYLPTVQSVLLNNSDNSVTDIVLKLNGIKDTVTNDTFNFLWLAFADTRPSGGWAVGANTFAYSDADYNGVFAPPAYPEDNVMKRGAGVDYSIGGAPLDDPNAIYSYWRDPNPGSVSLTRPKQYPVIDFLAAGVDMSVLTSFIRTDGTFFIGIDSDCRYSFDSITTDIHFTNKPKVPEPSLLLLFGSALAGLGFFSVCRKKIG